MLHELDFIQEPLRIKKTPRSGAAYFDANGLLLGARALAVTIQKASQKETKPTKENYEKGQLERVLFRAPMDESKIRSRVAVRKSSPSLPLLPSVKSQLHSYFFWASIGNAITVEAMFDECVIRGRRFAPARFCAPLVGYTHSAFRQLLAELGGCGAVWTEMLAARQILNENFNRSTWLRRHPKENLIYQLMVNSGDPIERVLARLEEAGVNTLDLNLGCYARSAHSCVAGCALFEDINSLRQVLQKVRAHWPHVLTAKIRLGYELTGWEARFAERLRLLEESGVDAIILHPRFFEERYKRRARHELYPWAASLTRLPLIANGDLTGPDQLQKRPQDFHSVSAIMLGRLAVAQPWIFANWDNPKPVDVAAVWDKLYCYVASDFPPALALRRMQMFNRYYAANFKFGHQFKVDLANASSLAEMRERAEVFFSRAPAIVAQPTSVGW